MNTRSRRLCAIIAAQKIASTEVRTIRKVKVAKVNGKINNVDGTINRSIKKAAKPLRNGKSNKKSKTRAITSTRQSPIDIRSTVCVHDPEECEVDSLNISYTMGDCHDVVTSDGGFKVNVGRKCTTTFAAKHLPGTYELAQFHAHWANEGNCGSEHLLDGKAMSGEVHFVFWNTKYGTFCKAADKEDGLAVIGVFLKEGQTNEAYAPLLDAIKKAKENDTPSNMPKNFVLEQLFPADRDYVTYLGSLTTPPYTESVIWTVLIHPVEISKDQLDVLRSITPSNFRECQDLCDRRVRASRNIPGF